MDRSKNIASLCRFNHALTPFSDFNTPKHSPASEPHDTESHMDIWDLLPCTMGIPSWDLWSMTADWRSLPQPRRRKQPIQGKDWRLSQTTTSPSLHSAGQPEPRPRKPDTNKEPESPGAGRGNPEDRTLVSAGWVADSKKGGKKNAQGVGQQQPKIINNQLNNQPCK